MIKTKITEDILKLAVKRSGEMGELRNSIEKGEGNVCGFLGEYLVAKLIGAKISDTFDFDLEKDGKTIDVKTKKCSTPPLKEYECSIWAKNITQKCDYYAFVRILDDYQTGWILGWLPKEIYFQKARFCKAGEKDKKSDFDWKFKEDCYNVEISQLNKFKQDKSI